MASTSRVCMVNGNKKLMGAEACNSLADDPEDAAIKLSNQAIDMESAARLSAEGQEHFITVKKKEFMQWVGEFRADVEKNRNFFYSSSWRPLSLSNKLEHDSAAMKAMIKQTFINKMIQLIVLVKQSYNMPVVITAEGEPAFELHPPPTPCLLCLLKPFVKPISIRVQPAFLSITHCYTCEHWFMPSGDMNPNPYANGGSPCIPKTIWTYRWR